MLNILWAEGLFDRSCEVITYAHYSNAASLSCDYLQYIEMRLAYPMIGGACYNGIGYSGISRYSILELLESAKWADSSSLS